MPLSDLMKKYKDEIAGENQKQLEVSAELSKPVSVPTPIEEVKQTDAERMVDLGSQEVQPDLDRITQWHENRLEMSKVIEQQIQNDPEKADVLKDFILEGPQALKDLKLPVAETLAKVLNFDTAISSGLARGLIRSLKGDGTPLDSFQAIVSIGNGLSLLQPITNKTVQESIAQSINENTGWAEVLKEAGVPEGPKVLGVALPKFKNSVIHNGMILPSHVALGIVDDIREGKVPVEFHQFGPAMTARGAVGLMGDILLSPLTYISFGSNKVLAKALGKTPSVVRFMDQTLLTEKAWAKGYTAMKQTKFGNAAIEFADQLLSADIAGGKGIRDLIGEAFNPNYKILQPIADSYRGKKRELETAIVEMARKFRDTFKDFTPEELLEYSQAKRARFEAEKVSMAAKKKYISEPWMNPKFAQGDKAIHEAFDPLMDHLGFPKDLRAEEYFPSIFEEFARATAYGSGIARDKKISGLMKTRFAKRDDLIIDPVRALTIRGMELLRASKRKEFIQDVIKNFGKNADEASKIGIDEFFPETAQKVFKGKETSLKNTPFDIGETAGGTKALNLDKVYLPKNVVESVERLSKQNKVTTNEMLKMYDQALSIQKMALTSPFPAFHFRNWGPGNHLQRYMAQGFRSFADFSNDANALRIITKSPELDKITIKQAGTGVEASLKSLAEEFKKEGLVSEYSHLMDDIVGGVKGSNLTEQAVSAKLSDFFTLDLYKNNFVKFTTEFGKNIENHQRLASALAAWKEGYSTKDAVKVAWSVLFNYGEATAFEKNVMKRIMPFYMYSSRNANLQVQTLLKNPGRQANVYKIVKDVRDEALSKMTPEQRESFNALTKTHYAGNFFAIPYGYVPGEGPLFMAGIGIPQEDFEDLFSVSGIAFKVSPLIKEAVNGLNKVLFDDRKVVGLKDRYTVKEAQGLFSPEVQKFLKPETVANFLKEARKGTYGEWARNVQTYFKFSVVTEKPKYNPQGKVVGMETELIADKEAMRIFRNLIVSRFMTTAKVFQDENKDEANKMAQFWTGYNFVKMNVQRQMKGEDKQLKVAAGNYLTETYDAYWKNILGTKKPSLRTAVKIFNKLD